MTTPSDRLTDDEVARLEALQHVIADAKEGEVTRIVNYLYKEAKKHTMTNTGSIIALIADDIANGEHWK